MPKCSRHVLVCHAKLLKTSTSYVSLSYGLHKVIRCAHKNRAKQVRPERHLCHVEWTEMVKACASNPHVSGSNPIDPKLSCPTLGLNGGGGQGARKMKIQNQSLSRTKNKHHFCFRMHDDLHPCFCSALLHMHK
jgi:hypothetical protein